MTDDSIFYMSIEIRVMIHKWTKICFQKHNQDSDEREKKLISYFDYHIVHIVIVINDLNVYKIFF